MFCWDSEKAEENLRKHGIDFRDAISIWEGITLRRASSYPDELRYLEFGMLDGIVITVVWTPRDGGRRVISAVAHEAMKQKIITTTLDDRGKGQTDWSRVRALSDADIDRAIASDPEEAALEGTWSEEAELIIPEAKVLLSLRIDKDVLDYFKSTGKGYQTRMNAVLRSYARQKSRQSSER